MEPLPERRPSPVVWTLALVWFVVHVTALVMTGSASHPSGSIFLWGAPSGDVLLRLGADRPALVALGEWQRLITYAFLHGFLLHLLLNTWVFFAVGRLLESVIGSSRLWIVFVVASIAGGGAHQVFFGGAIERAPPMVGASGGVFGAVGALGLWAFRSRHPAAPAARGTVLMFLVLSALLFFLPGIAHWGHLGGLAGGVLVMAALGPRRSERAASAGVKFVALLCLVLTGAAAAVQVSAGASAGRGELLEELASMERLAFFLYDNPDIAKPEKRRELGRRLDALLAKADDLDEEAAAALRAYLEAWRPVADGNVPDPFVFKAALDRATGAWAPHRRKLQLGTGR